MDSKAAWRERTRAWAVDLLGGVCIECGSADDLTFDHVKASTKTREISAMIRDGASRGAIAVELAKCQLLCRPHHIEKSKANGELGGGWNRVEDPAHGTQVMYGRLKCRCVVCRAWKRAYRAGRADSQGNPTG